MFSRTQCGLIFIYYKPLTDFSNPYQLPYLLSHYLWSASTFTPTKSSVLTWTTIQYQATFSNSHSRKVVIY